MKCAVHVAEAGPRAAGDRHPVRAGPSDYLRHNVYYTFSGFNWIPTFLEVLPQVGVDRMMFSTDHPHRSMTEATAFSRWFTAHAA